MKKGFIFDIQRFCLKDGPGIRTTVFLKGCPLSCSWCSNPESQSYNRELMYFDKKCITCGQCAAICKNNAIRVFDDHIVIDRDRCSLCGDCARACCLNALAVVGQYYRVDDVVEILMKDNVFYDASKGGVTISGGEPLMQVEFLKLLLDKLKKHHVHTAIETCGFWQWDDISDIFNAVDLVFFDIKHLINAKHIAGTGKENTIILNNLEKIVKIGQNMIVRIPLIPGFNMSYDNILKTALYVQDMGVIKIELIPYHRLGAGKYQALGKENPFDMMPESDDVMIDIKKRLKNDTNLDIV